MKTFLKQILDKMLAVPSIRWAIRDRSRIKIDWMRRLNGIQLSTAQLSLISDAIGKYPKCRLLVFGLGNDSLYWALLNRSGKTVFLEDNEFWIERVKRRSGDIDVRLVEYKTQRSDWKELLESPSRLEMSFPDRINDGEWDVVIVDAPAGYDDSTSGRMKSIYSASKLVAKSGDIFVHDCDREVEDIYCNTFLKPENLLVEVAAPYGDLRHYRLGTN